MGPGRTDRNGGMQPRRTATDQQHDQQHDAGGRELVLGDVVFVLGSQ